jgi:GNAT superfamily N-acetyltransferase
VLKIKCVRTNEEASAVYELAYEFVAWLRDRYPEMSAEIDTYLEHQKFDEQIRQVLIHYTPPKGECLLATQNDEPIGILMLKDLGGGNCEMNRMFVRDSGRGIGAGRALVNALVGRAKDMGFKTMTLSALPRHHEALALYTSCGFVRDNRAREPGNSDNAILMKLDLSAKP